MPTETSPPKRGRKPKQPAPVEPMQSTEQIVRIPLTELHPFPDHPYGIREDQAMQDTVDSVKQNGVVVPAIVRPRAEGGYEIVAGHRRKRASEQAGFTDMPCIIRNLTDDEAIIQLVDSNAQREDVLPSERARAYKMRLDAIKRQGARSDLEKIICFLKSGAYKPSPARRKYIAKKNKKKKRPLGIPSGDDKLVQEIVRMILESIFEPNFSNRSHGFRPNRSCHTALKQIHDSFTGAHWFVEGDIEACFDSFDHQVIVGLLRRRIDDEAFISLASTTSSTA